MTEPRWIRVTSIENIPAREGRAVQIGEREIAIFNLGERFLATDNRCPHKGGPLCDGIVTGNSVVCPLHTWKVNLGTGAVERPSAGQDRCVRTYPTRVEDGIVVVGVPRESPARESARNSFNIVASV
ncbi:MAG: nitrite reductase small subunit NirD [Vicinamibacterales bacterium]